MCRITDSAQYVVATIHHVLGYTHQSLGIKVPLSLRSIFGMPSKHSPAKHSSAAIEVRDAEASESLHSLSRKRKALERCKTMANQRNLARADRESTIYQAIDAMHEELRMFRSAKAGFALPKPAFKQGQSVLHWWAHWMTTATVTPKTYNTTHRPAWYSAEVLTYAGFKTLRYAGQEYTENVYNVF